MGHVLLNGVYDWQDGPRGDEKAFVSGMIMGMARRDFERRRRLDLRAMLSPDPFMGKSGYPLLLAAGETADGARRSSTGSIRTICSWSCRPRTSHRSADVDSVFLYAGLPGRAGVRAAGVHASDLRRWTPRGADHASLVRLHAHHLRRGHGRLGARGVEGRGLALPRARAGRAPLRLRRGEIRQSVRARSAGIPTQNWSLQVSWADLKAPSSLNLRSTRRAGRRARSTTYRSADDAFWATSLILGARDASDSESQFAVALESTYAPDRDWRFFRPGRDH